MAAINLPGGMSVIAGASPSNGNIVLSGFTGGTNNNLVYVLPDGVTCRDCHVSFINQLGYSTLLWKDRAGIYNPLGSIITEPNGTNLTPSFIRVLQPQTAVGVINYRDLDPAGTQPADLVPTINQAYLEIGKIIDPVRWQFRLSSADTLAQTPVSTFDGLLVANYPRAAAIPVGRFRNDRFAAYNSATPLTVNAITVSLFSPNGGQLTFGVDGTFKRRFATDEVAGSFADGQLFYDMYTNGPNSEYGLFMRCTGTAGVETCLLFTVDSSTATNNVKIGVLVAGAYTQLAVTSLAITHGSNYDWRVEAEGTWAAMKVWPEGGAEPSDWQLSAYQSTVAPGGFAGPYSAYPNVNVGRFSVVKNRGVSAALTGAT